MSLFSLRFPLRSLRLNFQLRNSYWKKIIMKQKKIICQILVFITSLIMFTEINAQSAPSSHIMIWQTPEELQKSADQSLRQLKKTIKKDGFASAMGALNIWRSNAQDAGIFDQTQYDNFRREIYQKSVNNILKWFETCLKEGWIDEAHFCCKMYRFKSNAIDVFDQTKYDEMKKRIQLLELEKQKQEEQKKKKRNKK